MKLQWLVICIVIVLSLKSVDLVALNLFFKQTGGISLN